MKYLGLFILFFKCYYSYSQTNWNEYIENPSFELYDTCPANVSTPGNIQLNTCLGWTIPTLATSDYFNSCNSNTVNVPNTMLGIQSAYDGVAFCGLYLNYYSYGIEPHYREYIQTKLKKKLTEGHIYELTFYVNIADKCGYSVKNISAIFTDNNINRNDWLAIVTTPQINSSNFITDTINWTKVTGSFIAKGEEQYLTIGNFKDTLEFGNDTLCLKPNTYWQDGRGASYCYIDGINFIDRGEALLPNIFTPNDDGINDFIDFKNFSVFNEFEATIFNRWGYIVFYTRDPYDLWNGKQNNNTPLNDGIYYYTINVSSTTKKTFLKGFIQLITN